MKNTFQKIILNSVLATVLVASLSSINHASAASAKEINLWTQDSLAEFKKEVRGADEVIKNAKGLLIFPRVYQGGFGVGAQYGEGQLLVDGKAVDYFNIASASFGWQLGGQRKSIIIAFMNDEVLEKFRNSQGWEFGVDASAAVINVGKEGSITTENINSPVLAFAVDQKGLMYNLSLEGTKVTRIKK